MPTTREPEAAPSWLICPLQHLHAPGSALCMADWQGGRPCTLSACAVYREIIAARSQIDLLGHRVVQIDTALKDERRITEALRKAIEDLKAPVTVGPQQEAPPPG